MYKRGILNNPAVLHGGLNFQPLERSCGSNKNYGLLLICLALAQLSVNLREQSSTDATGPKFMDNELYVVVATVPVARLIRLIPPPLSLRGVNVVRYVMSNVATIQDRERKKTDVFLFKNSQSTIQYQFSSSNSKNMLFSPIFITKLSIPRKKSVTLFTVIIEFPYQLSVQRDPNVHEQTSSFIRGCPFDSILPPPLSSPPLSRFWPFLSNTG